MSSRKAALLVIAVALAVRLGIALPMSSTTFVTPLSSTFLSDARSYTIIAKSILDHGVYGYGGRPSAFRPPLYPAMLAAIFAVTGEDYRMVRIVQSVLGTLGCLAIFGLGTILFEGRTGVLAGLGVSVFPYLVYYNSEIMTETLSFFLTTVAVFLTVAAWKRRTQYSSLFAGFAWGLACLCRPTAQIFVLGIGGAALWFLFRREHVLFWRFTVIAFVAALVQVPWMIRNSLLFERPVLLTTNAGLNLYKGLPGKWNETAVADIGYVKAEFESAEATHAPIFELELDERARKFWLKSVRENPAAFAKKKLDDFVEFWLSFSVGGSLADLPGAITFVTAAAYLGILLVAVIGSVRLFRERPGSVAVPWMVIIATSLAYLPFFTGKRFRVPTVDPYLVLLCAAYLGSQLERFRSGAFARYLDGDEVRTSEVGGFTAPR